LSVDKDVCEGQKSRERRKKEDKRRLNQREDLHQRYEEKKKSRSETIKQKTYMRYLTTIFIVFSVLIYFFYLSLYTHTHTHRQDT